MPNPRKPFRLNVGFIIHEEVGYSHEIPFEINKIKLEDLELQNFSGVVPSAAPRTGAGKVFGRHQT
jgi:hypothetical protein